MEARVDIRKLQLLNDRINQTIDALNQVRLSVHGAAAAQLSPYGLGHAVTPQITPFATPQIFPQQQPFGAVSPIAPWAGLQHAGVVAPVSREELLAEQMRCSDPSRLAQTFPYCFTAVSPYVGL